MSDEIGFIRVIVSEPEDDLPRLVYADWLEENDYAHAARFIRGQIAGELSTLPLSWLSRYEPILGVMAHRCRMMAEKGRAAARAPNGLVLEFRRGFVASITCTAEEWLGGLHEALYWSPKCVRCEGWGGVKVEGPASAYQMSRICPDCAGTGDNPRPCPPTAQPVTEVRLTTLPSAHVREFNALRPWVRPVGWGGDIMNSFAAEWPGITFTLPESARAAST